MNSTTAVPFFALLGLSFVPSSQTSGLGQSNLLISDIECVDVRQLKSYTPLSDKIVRLTTAKEVYLMTLSSSCFNLSYYSYMSYTPINGHLCRDKSEIRTRSGHSCTVKSFEIKKDTP
ncbi:DUF6491 family protein [Temperatibacter marinus]|uniref:DUF6491 family protein n=1 Tax=Temperatibacter marinus TaxID=1456591 RepID=A0AA52EDY0_9PROT|nr:DUF6491 family protein [Temperatibacter marinus]WND03692.1 DUF6491 family protein [Temperatibacter marinus]